MTCVKVWNLFRLLCVLISSTSPSHLNVLNRRGHCCLRFLLVKLVHTHGLPTQDVNDPVRQLAVLREWQHVFEARVCIVLLDEGVYL